MMHKLHYRYLNSYLAFYSQVVWRRSHNNKEKGSEKEKMAIFALKTPKAKMIGAMG